MSKIDPELYERCAVIEQVQLVIYAALKKSLYRNFRASLLFKRNLTANLIEWEYKINYYDYWFGNKIFHGSQCTVLRYVNYIKTSQLSQEVLEEEADLINNEFGQDNSLTISLA